MENLTPRQRRFVAEYAVCDNAAEAARRAGYSARSAKVTACRMLTKANLKAAIAAKKAEIAHKIELKREHILAGIFEAISAARQQENAGQMIRGWETVAKLTGLDKPEVVTPTVSAEGGRLRQKFEAMSVDELLAVASGELSGAQR